MQFWNIFNINSISTYPICLQCFVISVLSLNLSLIIFAGTPPTMALSGTSLTTTAFAPITALFPIVMPPKTFAPQHIVTLLSILGFLPSFTPIVTCWKISTFSPMLSAFIIVANGCKSLSPPPQF